MARLGQIAAAGMISLVMTDAALACRMDHREWLRTMPGFWAYTTYAVAAVYGLSAVLERPFLTLAGVRQHALSQSSVLALLSLLLIGFSGVVVLGEHPYDATVWLAWILMSVVLTALLKFQWLRRRATYVNRLRFTPVFAGCVVSAVVVAALPALGDLLGFGDYSHTARVRHIGPFVSFLLWIAAVIAVSVAGHRIRRDAPSRAVRGGGFEVIVAAPAVSIAAPPGKPGA